MSTAQGTYRIVCVDRALSADGKHTHIVGAGTGTDPEAADKQTTVAGVRAAIGNGTVFFTPEKTNKVAIVLRFVCACGNATIRSHADATTDNNLDRLRVSSGNDLVVLLSLERTNPDRRTKGLAKRRI